MAVTTTKPNIIFKLISRKTGASMTDLEKATGWQPHSIRAALTGLRKKGHSIERDKNTKGVTIYRVARDGQQ